MGGRASGPLGSHNAADLVFGGRRPRLPCPLVCRWTSRAGPLPGGHQQHHQEYSGTMFAQTYALISPGRTPGSGHAGSYGNCMFNRLRKLHALSSMAALLRIPTSRGHGSDLSTSPSAVTLRLTLAVLVGVEGCLPRFGLAFPQRLRGLSTLPPAWRPLPCLLQRNV